MLLRTLEVPDAQGQLLNAVLLCGFTATRINRQFLVYSLNEKSADDMVKIYLTCLEGDDRKLHMCEATAEVLTTATQVLKDIFRDACASAPRQTGDSYNLIDLAETDVQCSAVNMHHSLKISEAWLMGLLHYDPGTQVSALPLDSDNTADSTMVVTRPTSLLAEETLAEPKERITPKNIEANLKSVIASVINHKEMLLSKYVQLDERQRALEQREQYIQNRELALDQRDEELRTSVVALQDAEKQLNALLRS